MTQFKSQALHIIRIKQWKPSASDKPFLSYSCPPENCHLKSKNEIWCAFWLKSCQYKILKNSYHRSRIIEYAGSTNVKTTAKMKILQIVVTTVIGRVTILKRTVIVFLSLNRQAALTKLISDNKKANPCKSTLVIWLWWFSVGICKYKLGYKSHDLL